MDVMLVMDVILDAARDAMQHLLSSLKVRDSGRDVFFVPVVATRYPKVRCN